MKKTLVILLAAGFGLLFAGSALAQQFHPLAPIPGVTDGGTVGFVNYLNILFKLLIGLAAIFAVVKIAISGVLIMTSEALGTQATARENIRGALVGLIIILATYVILYAINPCLVKFDVFSQGEGQCARPAPPPPPPAPTTPPGSVVTRENFCSTFGGEMIVVDGDNVCAGSGTLSQIASFTTACESESVGGVASRPTGGGFSGGQPVGIVHCTFEVPDGEQIARCEAEGKIAYRFTALSPVLCGTEQEVRNYFASRAIPAGITTTEQSQAAIEIFQEGCAGAAMAGGWIAALDPQISTSVRCMIETEAEHYAINETRFLSYTGTDEALRQRYNALWGIFGANCGVRGGRLDPPQQGAPLYTCVTQ